MGDAQGASTVSLSGNEFGSVLGQWVDLHDDLETADTSDGELEPGIITTDGFHWTKTPPRATRVLLRSAITADATPSTAPVVILLGAYCPPGKDPATWGPDENGDFSSDPASDHYAHFARLDNADQDAAGITVPLTAADNGISDDDWDYGDPTTLDGYDCKGAWYVGAFTKTAAGAVADCTIKLQGLFLN